MNPDVKTTECTFPQDVVRRLFNMGALTRDDCTMVVGRYPVSLPPEIALGVRKMVCMDPSEVELDGLRDDLERRKLTNVERYCKDWNDYVPGKGYDTCVSCIERCPGDEHLARMDGTARRYGILICNDPASCEEWLEKNGRNYTKTEVDCRECKWHLMVWKTGERRAGT